MSHKQNPFKQIYESEEYRNAWERPLRDFPFILDLETTNRCNLSCVMCPRQIMERPEGMMDYHWFPALVKEGKEHGLLGLRFILFGEPTLNPALASMVAYAHTNKLLTHVTTNGLLLTKWKIDHLLRAGLDSIIISFQGTSPEEYQRMRGAHWSSVEYNIKNLVRMRREYGVDNPFITVTTTTLDETPGQIQAFEHYWLERGVDAVDHWETNLERVKAKISPELYSRQRLSRSSSLPPCNEVYTKMNLLWDGRAVICCDDVNCDVAMGQFPAQSLYNIWHNTPYMNARKHFQENDWLPLCQACHNRF